MIKIKVVVGTKQGNTFQKEISENKISALLDLKIGDTFDGSIVDLTNYTLEVTGMSDKQGFPARKSLKGPARRSLILKKGVGFKNVNRKGVRKRKSLRGNVVSDDIAQLNVKVVKKGKDSVEKLWNSDSDKKEEKQEENK